eukprot:Em0166g3a
MSGRMGVVVYAQNCHSMNFKVQEEWYESLRDWDADYKAYQNKQYLRPDPQCHVQVERPLPASRGLGAVDDETRQKMSIVASAAAWGLGEWNRMKEYAGTV